jgi:drug/metabolite transporter (DMT)-like permease
MQSPRTGVALLLAFIASQAVRDVHLGHLFGELGLVETALLAFGSATAVFGAAMLVWRRDQIGFLLRHWRIIVMLNVTTAIAWLCYFGSLRLIEPAATNLAFSGVAPAAVAIWAWVGLTAVETATPSRTERALHWVLFAIVMTAAGAIGSGQAGLPGVEPLVGIGGVALAALAGFSITAETIWAKRMNVAGVSPLAIVGTRFLLVTCIAGAMVAGQAENAYATMDGSALARQAAVLLIILIGPIYLAQLGLSLTGPLASGVILALGPVATLALQSSAGDVVLVPAILFIVAAYALVSIVIAILSVRQTPTAVADKPTAVGSA